MPTLAQLRGHAAHVPPWAWAVLVVIAAAGVLVWHQWYTTRGEGDAWLDPEQPPPNIGTSVVPAERARRRPYPPSLVAMPECPAGDC
jgi:hypothetical protein